MNKKEKKAYQKTTTVGKIHPALNYTLAGALINKATMKKTSTTTEHKGLRQDLRTGAYYHKAPANRPTKSGGNGGVTTVAKASTGATARIAGVDNAKKLGFTHTNPANTSFSESENVPIIGSPTKAKERELTTGLSKSRILQLKLLKEELDSKGEDTSHIDAELFALQG